MYDKIKKYYGLGLWDERRVRDAVNKNIITAEQFQLITGKQY